MLCPCQCPLLPSDQLMSRKLNIFCNVINPLHTRSANPWKQKKLKAQLLSRINTTATTHHHVNNELYNRRRPTNDKTSKFLRRWTGAASALAISNKRIETSVSQQPDVPCQHSTRLTAHCTATGLHWAGHHNPVESLENLNHLSFTRIQHSGGHRADTTLCELVEY